MTRRAVLCEDDLTLRRVIESVLRNVGIEVMAEGDSVPVLNDVISYGRPDVVILDLMVVGVTNTDQAFEDVRFVATKAPVVVFSAHDALRARALEAGARAFVDKPNFDELARAVVEVVGPEQLP